MTPCRSLRCLLPGPSARSAGPCRPDGTDTPGIRVNGPPDRASSGQRLTAVLSVTGKCSSPGFEAC